VLVGEDPASQVYTRNKEKASKEVGIAGNLRVLPATTSQAELLALLDGWNRDEAVDGILVQLPLPKQIDSLAVLDAVHPGKDVDGFHPINVGLLASAPGLVRAHRSAACASSRAPESPSPEPTPSSSAAATSSENPSPSSSSPRRHRHHRPLEDPRPPAVCRSADVLVAAVGRPEMVRGDWIKEGAVVIDVGINRVEAEGARRGSSATSASTRRRNGLPRSRRCRRGGPMTIAYLLANTVRARKRARVGRASEDQP